MKKLHLPTKTKIWYHAAFCLSLVNIIAMVSVIKEMPALVPRHQPWDVLGSIAYSLTFALVESGGLFILTVVLAVLLTSFFREMNFQITALMMCPLVFYTIMFSISPEGVLILGIVALGGLALIIARITALKRLVDTVLDRISLLGALYLVLDIASVLIVFLRNVF